MTTPAQEHILQFFAYEHLPAHLQKVSAPFCELAKSLVAEETGLVSPYRTPADRPRGPRWGATWWARLWVRFNPHPELREARRARRRGMVRLDRDIAALVAANARLLAVRERGEVDQIVPTEPVDLSE